MTHFEPRPSQIKEHRHNDADKTPMGELRPPYTLWSLSLFRPKMRDRAGSCFLSTLESVDSDLLQRCMDLVFPWRVDLYIVSGTFFQVQFHGKHGWRDIIKYTRQAFEEMI